MLRITPARKAWHSRKRSPQQYPRRLHMPTLICDCNKTMPLQEKSLGAALGEELQLHSSLCRREAGDFQQAIKGGAEVVVACTQEKRLFGEIGEQTEGRGIARQVRQHPRDGRLEPRRFASHAQVGRLAGRRAPARPRAGAHRHVQEFRPLAGDRFAGTGRTRRWFRERRAGRHLVHARRRGRAGAALPGSRRTHRQPQGLAGRFRAEMDRQQPDRPGPVHALQCLRGGMPGRRHRAGLPDRHGQMRLAPRLREGLRSRGRHRFQPRERGLHRTVRPGAGPARRAGICPACAAPGLFPLGRPGPGHAAQAARDGGRVRKAQVLRLQAEALRPQPQRNRGLQRLHRGLFGRGDQQREIAASRSRSIPTCAWAAGPAPRSVPPVR